MGSKDCKDIIEILDAQFSIIASFSTTLSYIDLFSLISRYYISIQHVVLPVAIDDEKLLAYTTFFEPVFNIYLHENRVYAALNNVKYFQLTEGSQWSRISVIDLTQNDNLVAIAAASIAEKIHSSPSERGILKVLPSNLKTYVDTAFNLVKTGDSCATLFREGRKMYPAGKPLEMILWSRKTTNDSVREIAYLRGVSMRAIKIAFTDYDVEVKMYRSGITSFGVLQLLEKIVGETILTSMHRNIDRVTKILATVIKIIG